MRIRVEIIVQTQTNDNLKLSLELESVKEELRLLRFIKFKEQDIVNQLIAQKCQLLDKNSEPSSFEDNNFLEENKRLTRQEQEIRQQEIQSQFESNYQSEVCKY
ncbi:hypothetical protein FGO68_gene2108 [Halteria grandinella]|uniref:Uncharacterized protein n=1 Tax=Halteria grandinella TaxID=5974 RepID=A0A8J8SXA4_HALGN|nr:hypothetical protein FGO68_gene2108 [Halteria grandinella]